MDRLTGCGPVDWGSTPRAGVVSHAPIGGGFKPDASFPRRVASLPASPRRLLLLIAAFAVALSLVNGPSGTRVSTRAEGSPVSSPGEPTLATIEDLPPTSLHLGIPPAPAASAVSGPSPARPGAPFFGLPLRADGAYTARLVPPPVPVAARPDHHRPAVDRPPPA